jgi:hypothetical protein
VATLVEVWQSHLVFALTCGAVLMQRLQTRAYRHQTSPFTPFDHDRSSFDAARVSMDGSKPRQTNASMSPHKIATWDHSS